jgi:hypothetical protein
LIFYNIEQKTQKFVPIVDGDGISTIQISPGQGYVAVAVRSIERGPFIVVFDLQNTRRKKVLTLPEGSNAKVPPSIHN